MHTDAACFYSAARQLPECCAPLLHVSEDTARCVTEIRIRSARPIVLSAATQSLFVQMDGSVIPAREPTEPLPSASCGVSPCARPLVPQAVPLLQTAHAAVCDCFHALCGYSVHSYETCIAQGFVPMRGGHRAGICGTAVLSAGQTAPETLKNITSINIRIARPALLTCAPALLRILAQPEGILLAGPPGSGKTTLLRAILHALSAQGLRVAAVDERFEIAPVASEGFAAPVPLHCDVLSGYPKHVGMLHALRSLAPDVLVCDEIGGADDVRAVESAANAGVRMVVTLHGGSRAQVLARPQVRALLDTGAFRYLVLLRGKSAPGDLEEVADLASVV